MFNKESSLDYKKKGAIFTFLFFISEKMNSIKLSKKLISGLKYQFFPQFLA